MFDSRPQMIGTTALPPARRLSITPRRIAAVAIGIALLGFIGWFAAVRQSSTSAPHYITAQVSRGLIARTVSASGTVNPVMTIIVGSYISGVIRSISCDFNTKVTKGQLCATIDPRPYETIVEQNRASLSTADAQLTKDKANLAYAQLSYDRSRELAAHGDVSAEAVDNALSLLSQAKAQVALDQASINQHKAALDAAVVNLDYTKIVSPVDGVVVSRNVTIGQTVAASFQTPTLFLIATDLSQMQIDANVSESDIGGVKEGNAARFTVEAYPHQIFEGRVVQVRQAPQSVQNVVTYDVVISVDNKDGLLRPGMTATTNIVVAQVDDAVRVPVQALRFNPEFSSKPASQQSHVWVLKDGKTVETPVTTGLDDQNFVQLLSGDVKSSDAVIVGEGTASRAVSTRPIQPRFP